MPENAELQRTTSGTIVKGVGTLRLGPFSEYQGALLPGAYYSFHIIHLHDI